jgi:hypothetical protein
MTDAKKSIYDYKLGEVIENKEKHFGRLKDIFDGEVRLLQITYSFQDKNGTSMKAKLTHNDYIDEEEDNKCNTRVEYGDEDEDE